MPAIAGVPTSTTAFVGRAARGPVETPTEIRSFADYTAVFGGLSMLSPMSYSVSQYFANGGQRAVIVRVVHAGSAATARFSVPGSTGSLLLDAASPGSWANNLRIAVDSPPYTTDSNLFSVSVSDPGPPNGTAAGTIEILRDVSTDPGSSRFVTRILAEESRSIRVAAAGDAVHLPAPTRAGAEVTAASTGSAAGSDGGPIEDGDLDDAAGRSGKRGIYALEKYDLFNLLVIPPHDMTSDVGTGTWASAAAYCRARRAFLIVDPPLAGFTPPATPANTGFAALTAALAPSSPDAQNAAYFLPPLRALNPLTSAPETFAPSGAIAGVFARTDATRGVWKAAAGIEAGITGVLGLAYPLTEAESASLNRLGANGLRTFDTVGTVVWGARTLQGDDALASDDKYIPVRRLALYIEESLVRGTRWTVFEPNGEPLWAQIRLVVGTFMEDLFRQGAFQGNSSREAYFVKCDGETTSEADIDLGVVNILIGFAPSRPAEFVPIAIRQTARRPDA